MSAEVCAACGQPGHRFGRNEGMDRFDPQACINGLRGRIDDMRADRKKWRYCPICGRPNRPEGGGKTGVAYCSPTNCGAWKVSATFDHDTREWVPVRVESEGQA